MGGQQQTKYCRCATPPHVTVTRRHHPLQGQRLDVVSGGPRQVVVRLSNGTSMKLPRTWTDADAAPAERATESIFSVESVRELIELVESFRQRASKTPPADVG